MFETATKLVCNRANRLVIGAPRPVKSPEDLAFRVGGDLGVNVPGDPYYLTSSEKALYLLPAGSPTATPDPGQG